ncbi:hypothetical protein NKR19_g5673 [Coniochaeta hoffmannii]|uniref:Mid2 domain-containing protein n=1 Tax=Coniochaeta hoffmannii TaxID=91930 RepID=A0AA38RW53_9PEZI|nr:hypothetical protein NKR19_g5673 [Coniochaeta hoffmannii]
MDDERRVVGNLICSFSVYPISGLRQLHEPAVGTFENGDLSSFPAILSEHLDAATEAYLATRTSQTSQASQTSQTSQAPPTSQTPQDTAPTTQVTASPASTPSNGGRLSPAIIGGIATGVVISLLVLAGVLFFCIRMHRRTRLGHSTPEAPELDGNEKSDGGPPRELHSDPKPAELGIYRHHESASGLSAFPVIQNIQELEAGDVQIQKSPGSAPAPAPALAVTEKRDLVLEGIASSPILAATPETNTRHTTTAVVSPDLESPHAQQAATGTIPKSSITEGPGSHAGTGHSLEDTELRSLEEEEERIRERKKRLLQRKGIA